MFTNPLLLIAVLSCALLNPTLASYVFNTDEQNVIQGDGIMCMEWRQYQPFDNVVVFSDTLNKKLQVSFAAPDLDPPLVQVQGDRNVVPYVITEFSPDGGPLQIRIQGGVKVDSINEVKVYILGHGHEHKTIRYV